MSNKWQPRQSSYLIYNVVSREMIIVFKFLSISLTRRRYIIYAINNIKKGEFGLSGFVFPFVNLMDLS